jgi:aryl-alcohol dehydrogenase-like predicted oxidoreductase
MKALAYADCHHAPRFVSAQMYYSIAGRDIEREIVPLAKDEGLAILPWSPLAGGLLSGKFDLENPGPANARRATFDFPPVDRARAKTVLGVMRAVAGRMGVSVARIALSWMLTRSFVTSIIIGAKTVEQLADNLASTEVMLAAADVARLDEASALPLEYPGWMLDWQNQERRPEKTFP